jgi:hypothetical protein
VEKITLTAEEFHGYTSKNDYFPSNIGSSTYDDGKLKESQGSKFNLDDTKLDLDRNPICF